MNSRPIGIFDSGVGGLTVLSEIRKQMPNENLIYLGDTKNFPYGSKTRESIINFSINNVEFLINNGVKLIVIACGTATSHALTTLKKKYNLPIIGIIEPTVQYVKKREMKIVGVIATEGTIKSNSWENSLKQAMPNIEVINKACPMLAEIAEEGMATSSKGRSTIKEYMMPFKERGIDKIILGCTHYPIYQELIKEEIGYPVELINTGKHVSNYISEYLNKNNMRNLNKKVEEKIILTKSDKNFEKISKKILNFDIKIV